MKLSFSLLEISVLEAAFHNSEPFHTYFSVSFPVSAEVVPPTVRISIHFYLFGSVPSTLFLKVI